MNLVESTSAVLTELERMDIPTDLLETLPGNQYHQMVCIIAKNTKISYNEVMKILQEIR